MEMDTDTDSDLFHTRGEKENSNCIIEPNKMNLFPYAFTGIVRATFQSVDDSETVEGAGIIIGEDVVLTSGEILYHKIHSQGNFTFPKTVEFVPWITGNIHLIHGVVCPHYVIPEKYRQIKKKENTKDIFMKFTNTDESTLYNYGIIFLGCNIGYGIVKIFGFENDPRFLVSDERLRLFNWFETHSSKFENILWNAYSEWKVAVVSYTTEDSNNNFIYLNSFEKLKKKYSLQKKFKFSVEKESIGEVNPNPTTLSADASTKGNSKDPVNVNLKNYHFFNKDHEYNTSSNFSLLYFSGDCFFDSNKFVLCESQGILYINNKRCSYVVETFGALSGSPVFIVTGTKNEIEYSLISLYTSTPYSGFFRLSNSIDLIKESILKKKSDMSFFFTPTIMIPYTHEFYIIDLVSYNQIILRGVFHKQSAFANVFEVAGKLFNVEDLFFKIYYLGRSYKLDIGKTRKMTLCDIISIQENNFEDVHLDLDTASNSNSSPCMKFDIEIDIEHYSKMLAQKILLQLKENDPHIEEKLSRKENEAIERGVEGIIKYIEQFSNKSQLLYGLLFQSIKASLFNE